MTFCDEHQCLKDKVEEVRGEKKFWHRLLNSKWSYFIITGMVTLSLIFIGWTVREINAQKAETKQIITICSDIKEIKEDNKSRDEKREGDKKVQEEQRRVDEAQRAKDQKDMMMILLDIQKQIKK